MSWLERNLGGHISIGAFTFFGYNAMCFAVNYWSKKRHTYFCFRPTTWCYGRRNGWYFYISPCGTPWAATFAIGPGVSLENKIRAKLRRGGHATFWAYKNAVDRIMEERKSV